jgi:hypothetical protein
MMCICFYIRAHAAELNQKELSEQYRIGKSIENSNE